jgi:hypothetical protein
VVHFNYTNMAAMGIYETEQHQHGVLNSWFDYGPGGELTWELFVACFSVCPDKCWLSTLQQVRSILYKPFPIYHSQSSHETVHTLCSCEIIAE